MKWNTASLLKFFEHGKQLNVEPYVLILVVERIRHDSLVMQSQNITGQANDEEVTMSLSTFISLSLDRLYIISIFCEKWGESVHSLIFWIMIYVKLPSGKINLCILLGLAKYPELSWMHIKYSRNYCTLIQAFCVIECIGWYQFSTLTFPYEKSVCTGPIHHIDSMQENWLKYLRAIVSSLFYQVIQSSRRLFILFKSLLKLDNNFLLIVYFCLSLL